jgi:hypothetical protein
MVILRKSGRRAKRKFACRVERAADGGIASRDFRRRRKTKF